jgi:hypothetical protein
VLDIVCSEKKDSLMSKSFSERHGYRPPDPPITVREDAPAGLRFAVAFSARKAGLEPSVIRDVVCQVLSIVPDSRNWSEHPNIWDEVLGHLRTCEWFRVYDIVEAVWRHLGRQSESQLSFCDDLNRVFRENGIGWELKDPDGIVFRGGETFGLVTTGTVSLLLDSGRHTAADEIREAIKDISRRPVADRTGAVQHAIAALECTARDVSGRDKANLGELTPRLDLPKPLDEAVVKLWGFASERARHLREGRALADDEAQLVVEVACALCGFLSKRAAR